MAISMGGGSMNERRMAERLVDVLLQRGLLVSVDDGEEIAVSRSRRRGEIVAALGATDMETVIAYRPGNPPARVGSFLLVWGNEPDGSELIADYTDNDTCEDVWKELTEAR